MPGYACNRFVNLSKSDKAELTCSICQEIFCSPLVAQCCQQSFCRDCINGWLKSNNTCPYDRKPMTLSLLSRPPRVMLNMLGKLKIHCDFKQNGCKEVMLLENLRKHTVNCRYNVEKCKKCLTEIKENSSHDCIKILLELNRKANEKIETLRRNAPTKRRTLSTTVAETNGQLAKNNMKETKQSLLKEIRELKAEKENFLKTIEELSNNREQENNSNTSSFLISEQINEQKETLLELNRKANEEKETLLELNRKANEEKETLLELNRKTNEEKETLLELNRKANEEKEILLKEIFELKSEKECFLKTNQELSDNNEQQNNSFSFSEQKLINHARKQLWNTNIISKDMDADITNKVLSVVRDEIKESNSISDVCKNVTNKLNTEFGSHWDCIFSHQKSDTSSRLYESRHFISFKLAELYFQIYKNKSISEEKSFEPNEFIAETSGQLAMNSLREQSHQNNIHELKAGKENFLKTIEELSNNREQQNTQNDTKYYMSEQEIFEQARAHLMTPEVIKIDMNQDIENRVLSIIKEEIIKENISGFEFCKNIKKKLDAEYGGDWNCIVGYQQIMKSFVSYEEGHFIKIKFDELHLLIYKTHPFYIPELLQRLKNGNIGHEFKILGTDMKEKMIFDVKDITFEAIEKSNSFHEISQNITEQMLKIYRGNWQCFLYTHFGDFCILKKSETFISLAVDNLNLTLFQSSTN